MKTLLLFFLLGFSHIAFANDAPRFFDEDHPLINKIWDTNKQAFVQKIEVISALLEADYIFLGESHDNPRHHALQNWALNVLIDADIKPGVAFEMLNEAQLKGLDLNNIKTATALFDAVNWEESGWPHRALYHDLFQTVITAELALYSANLEKPLLREIISQTRAPSENVQQLLALRPLSDKESQAMLKELTTSHCDMLPEHHIAGMITGQRVRDARMALSLLDHKRSHATPAVLIAGNAHIRLDRGAPTFIHQHQPEAKTLSIAWHEVRAESLTPQQYTKIWHTSPLPFDYVWFTPRLDRPDPCEEIKRFINKKNKPSANT